MSKAKQMSNPNGNIKNLRPWTSKDGDNPPPRSPGAPRKRPQSEANDDLLRMTLPEDWRKAINTVKVDGVRKPVELLKPGATFADAIAVGLGKKAIAGDATCAKELRESVEGRSVQRIEMSAPEDRGFEVRVTFESPTAPRRPAPEVEGIAREVSREVEGQVVKSVVRAALAEENE